MRDIEYKHYSPQLLPALVEFWNDEFRDRRNFFPVTERVFAERVINGRSAVESFEPGQITLACAGEKIAAMMHCLDRPEQTCARLLPDWPGGSQRVIAFFAVARDFRRAGIGAELFRRASERLDARQLIIDGQCLTPFYGNSTAPFTPFWGTPEGPSISEDDTATVEFLAARGFEPRYRAVTLQADITRLQIPAPPASAPPDGCEIRIIQTDAGAKATSRKERGRPECFTASCSRGDRVIGALVFYAMTELAAERCAIYHFEVIRSERGAGIGGAVLEAALAEMKSRGWGDCEVLTIPQISPAGIGLYEKYGFSPAARWLIY